MRQASEWFVPNYRNGPWWSYRVRCVANDGKRQMVWEDARVFWNRNSAEQWARRLNGEVR